MTEIAHLPKDGINTSEKDEAMRFHYAESMTPIANGLPLAQAAEANGYPGFHHFK